MRHSLGTKQGRWDSWNHYREIRHIGGLPAIAPFTPGSLLVNSPQNPPRLMKLILRKRNAVRASDAELKFYADIVAVAGARLAKRLTLHEVLEVYRAGKV